MRVEISADAAAYVHSRGGRLWVWAAYPALRCDGMQATMHAATRAPLGDRAFATWRAYGVEVRFSEFRGLRPDVLQIAMHGRLRPRVEAYWDGCLFAT